MAAHPCLRLTINPNGFVRLAEGVRWYAHVAAGVGRLEPPDPEADLARVLGPVLLADLVPIAVHDDLLGGAGIWARVSSGSGTDAGAGQLGPVVDRAREGLGGTDQLHVRLLVHAEQGTFRGDVRGD